MTRGAWSAVRGKQVVAHPEDVRMLVAHDPPLVALLEDRETAIRVIADIVKTYHRAGYDPVVFPGDHGGFAANAWSPHNDPAAFAARLRELLDE
jgi:hypothetical protein